MELQGPRANGAKAKALIDPWVAPARLVLLHIFLGMVVLMPGLLGITMTQWGYRGVSSLAAMTELIEQYRETATTLSNRANLNNEERAIANDSLVWADTKTADINKRNARYRFYCILGPVLLLAGIFLVVRSNQIIYPILKRLFPNAYKEAVG